MTWFNRKGGVSPLLFRTREAHGIRCAILTLLAFLVDPNQSSLIDFIACACSIKVSTDQIHVCPKV